MAPMCGLRMTARPHSRDVSPPNLSGALGRRFFVLAVFFALGVRIGKKRGALLAPSSWATNAVAVSVTVDVNYKERPCLSAPPSTQSPAQMTARLARA